MNKLLVLIFIVTCSYTAERDSVAETACSMQVFNRTRLACEYKCDKTENVQGKSSFLIKLSKTKKRGHKQ